MRVLVLLNRAAGGTAGHEQVAAAFARAGVQADVRTVEPARLGEMASRARHEGFDAVVAAGGDGTVRSVAEALAGGEVPLGVLPLGTRNHFAKDLGVPTELDAAVRALADAEVRAVDVGEVNGLVFVNTSSIGLYPLMVEEREARRARSHGGKGRAMLVAGWRVLRRFPRLRLRIVDDEGEKSWTTPLVFVGNNRHDLGPRAHRPRLDAGELGIVAAHVRGPVGFLRLCARLLAGRLEGAPGVEATARREMWVDAHRAKLHVSLDGEVRRLAPPLHYVSRPRALRVLAPREGAS